MSPIKKYFIYRHTRSDTNEVFYIGKGTTNIKGKNETTLYRRAYQFSGDDRSVFWHNITNKTDYQIDILFSTDDANTINQKEIEFIKLYGRRDISTGTLVNMSDGGDGRKNPIVTEKTREKMKRNCAARLRTGKNHPRHKVVYVYNILGNFIRKFETITEASRNLKITSANIQRVLANRYFQIRGMIFFRDYRGEKITVSRPSRKNAKKIICQSVEDDKQLNFESLTQASLYFNSSVKRIYAACVRKSIHKKFKFGYADS